MAGIVVSATATIRATPWKSGSLQTAAVVEVSARPWIPNASAK
jgi:hypothetical protein